MATKMEIKNIADPEIDNLLDNINIKFTNDEKDYVKEAYRTKMEKEIIFDPNETLEGVKEKIKNWFLIVENTDLPHVILGKIIDDYSGKTFDDVKRDFNNIPTCSKIFLEDNIIENICKEMIINEKKELSKEAEDNAYIDKAFKFLFIDDKDDDIKKIYKKFYPNNEINNAKNEKYVLEAFAAELLLKNIRFNNWEYKEMLSKFTNSEKTIENTRKIINNFIRKGKDKDGNKPGMGHNHLAIEDGIPKKYLVISRYLQLTMFEKYYYKSDMIDPTNILNSIDWAIFYKLDKDCLEIINNNLKFINYENEKNANQFVNGRYSIDDVIRYIKSYAFANYFLNYYINHPYDLDLKEDLDDKNKANMEHIINGLSNTKEKKESFIEFCKFINMFLSVSSKLELTKEEYTRIYFIFNEIYENLYTIEENDYPELKCFNDWITKKQFSEEERYRQNLGKIDPYVYDSNYDNKLEEVIKIYNNENTFKNKTEEEMKDILKEELYWFYDKLINNSIEIPIKARIKMLGKTEFVNELKQFSLLEKRIHDVLKVNFSTSSFILPNFIYCYPLVNTLQLLNVIKNKSEIINLESWMYGNKNEFYAIFKYCLDNSIQLDYLKTYNFFHENLNLEEFKRKYNLIKKVQSKQPLALFFDYKKIIMSDTADVENFSVVEYLIEQLCNYKIPMKQDTFRILLDRIRPKSKNCTVDEKKQLIKDEVYFGVNEFNSKGKLEIFNSKNTSDQLIRRSFMNIPNLTEYNLTQYRLKTHIKYLVRLLSSEQMEDETSKEVLKNLIKNIFFQIEFSHEPFISNSYIEVIYLNLLKASMMVGADLESRIDWFKNNEIKRLFSVNQLVGILTTNIDNTKLKKIVDLIQKGYDIDLENKSLNENNIKILHFYIIENNYNFTQEKLNFYLYNENDCSYNDISLSDENIINYINHKRK